jgi:hypothetical protein
MDKNKKKALEASGWQFGSTEDFLESIEENMQRIIHKPRYTIREIPGGPCEIPEDIFDLLVKTTEFTMNELKISNHLFISIVGAETVATDEYEYSFGVYHSGMQHITIAASDGSGFEDFTPEEFREDLMLTLIHEIYHFYQDINENMFLDNYEEEAEQKSQKILDKYLGY